MNKKDNNFKSFKSYSKTRDLIIAIFLLFFLLTLSASFYFIDKTIEEAQHINKFGFKLINSLVLVNANFSDAHKMFFESNSSESKALSKIILNMEENLHSLKEAGQIFSTSDIAGVMPLVITLTQKSRLVMTTARAYTLETSAEAILGATEQEVKKDFQDVLLSGLRESSVGIRFFSLHIQEKILYLNNIIEFYKAILGVMMVLGCGASLLFWIRLRHALARPIRLLVEQSKRIANRDFPPPFDELAHDDLGKLASAINEMSTKLKDSTASLDDLKAARDMAASVFKGSGDALRIVHNDFSVSDVNPAYLKLSGLTRVQALALKCYEHFEGNKDCDKKESCTLKLHEENVHIEKELITKDGRIVPVEIVSSPLVINEQTIGISESFRDITARRKAEESVTRATADLQEALLVSESLREDIEIEREKAEKSSKTKADFLANMSHEIRTPMNAILGFTDLLKKTELNEKQRTFLNTISSSGDLLLGIINDILDFSKIESGKITLEILSFNLRLLLNDVFKIAVTRSKENHFDTYIDFDPNVPIHIVSDPTRLRQILVNLLGNAVKFTAKGSVGVIVTCLAKKIVDGKEIAQLKITVKDTGIGIDPSKITNIFESFTQADTSTTRRFGGTGLGLSICKSIVTALGGNIWAESIPGEGSEFIFTFSAEVSKISDLDEIQPLARTDLRGKRVMIIDDNVIIQKVHKKCCESIGLEIVSVHDSSSSAINRLHEIYTNGEKVDILLCDILMEGMSGYEFARVIREEEKFKGIKLIALTSDPKIGDADLVEKVGFDAYLPKPVTLVDLENLIATTLGDHRKTKAIITRHIAGELACKGMRVLLVEDVVANQVLVEEYFKELCCQYQIASNGQEAVDIIKEGKQFDAILMDVQMPVLSGLEATIIIRKELKCEIPIIALTAAVLDEDKKEALASGMVDFLKKPIELSQLRDMLLKYKRGEI